MEKQKYVVSETDLQDALKLKGGFGRFIARRILRFLEIDKINAIHEKLMANDGPDFSEAVLKEVGVTYEILPEQLKRIPEEGGFITVSNHHFGSIDGLILSSVVGGKRKDYRILTTFLLALIPSLKSSFMPVDNLSGNTASAKSIHGIRMALQHIHDGGALGFFPAGEVATYQKKGKRTAISDKKVIEDKPWAENIIKLIKNSGFPVIPIYFEGTNSKFFHFLGKIHPRLRTVRLIHEMLNKKGTHVKVHIGQPVSPEEISKYSVPELGRYLRNRTYALQAECIEKKEQTGPNSFSTPVISPVDPELVAAEMLAAEDRILFEYGDYRVYLSEPDRIPNAMKELYRLREETFRAVGEGTGNPYDTDSFDSYFHHLILWNIPNKEIVGSYRIGVGTESYDNHGGIDGFYTSTLFNYNDASREILRDSLELGRTFVRQKYQREIQSLRLLLTGLAATTLRFPAQKYFLGPVSISNEFPDFYKSLTVWFLENKASDAGSRALASPTNAFKPDWLGVDPAALLQKVDTVDELDKLIATLSDGKYRLPVLVKKYFNYGARLICFNVDPDFNNSLDGLILLPLRGFPKDHLKTLVKVLPQDQQELILSDSPLS